MSDDNRSLAIGAIQQNMARPIDPEKLELMGKRAAAMFRDNGMPLSQSVVEVVKEARLAPEQVKRVCEFANTSAYLDAFEKAGEMRNVTFDGGPANPAVVLQDLNDGSSPAIQQTDSNDYAAPAGSYKSASGFSELADAFQVQAGSMSKTASAAMPDQLSHADPVDDVNDLRIRLESARDTLMSKLSSSGVIYEDISRDLCNSVTQEIASGTSLTDVYRAWSSVEEPAILKEAAALVSDHLTKNGYKVDKLVKTAGHSVVNLSHPVMAQYIAFTKVAHGHRVLSRAIGLLDTQLYEVRAKLGQMVA